jgi:ABC-type cobalamin/Fe3+-siderophores transport system ATPase subunit
LTELNLRGVWCAPIKNLSATFGVGMHVILGSPGDGTAELIELCAGLRLPHRGWLSLDGQAPASSPETRRHIASVLPREDGDVKRSLLELARRAGGSRHFDGARALGEFAPELDPQRALAESTEPERRRFALALALGQSSAKLLLLHHPLSLVNEAFEAALVEQLAERAQSAVVVATVASVADARRLGGTLGVLERGVLSRAVSDAWPNALTPGLDAALWVQCDAPRELLGQLASHAAVSAVSYDERAFASRLEVRGRDLEALAVAVSQAALRADVQLQALSCAAPDLEAVHGASAGLAHAAYRAAQGNSR